METTTLTAIAETSAPFPWEALSGGSAVVAVIAVVILFLRDREQFWSECRAMLNEQRAEFAAVIERTSARQEKVEAALQSVVTELKLLQKE